MAFKAITVNTPAADPAHILAEDDAALYESIIGGDCVLPIGQKMAATVQSNNKVRIADGVVVVGGHVGRIVKGDYVDMTIANGQSGKKRNDIIVARFLAGSSGGSDSYTLVVVQGAAGTTAADPAVVKGDLYDGDKQRDYPLWRVCIDGLSITKVEQMYEVGVTSKDLSELFVKTAGYNYSTEETVIGKWIDGRNLYRKVFNIGQLTGSGGNTSKPHGITNFDRAIHLYGSARNTSLESRFTVGIPYPAVTSTQINISLQANNKNIQVYHPSDAGNYSAVVVMEYIKIAD